MQPNEQASLERVLAELAALRDDVAKLHGEVAELRSYIGEVPAMECGITDFDEWRTTRG